MNTSELETVGTKIVASGGARDTLARRRLNTSPDTVANITAEEIEKGQVTIETLEKLNTPCYLYSSQVTIHGKLPDITNRHDALGYKSIIMNGNGTLGVKYTAIDAGKKSKIADTISIWRTEKKADWFANSQDFAVYRYYGTFTEKNQEKYPEAVQKAQADLEAMPKCFYGDARVMRTSCYGVISLYLIAYIGAIHEADVETIASWFTGHTTEETATQKLANDAKDAQDKAEREARWEQEKQEDLARKQKATEELEASLKDNPPTGYKGLGEYNYKMLVRGIDGQYTMKEGIVTFTQKGQKIVIKYNQDKGNEYTQERFDTIMEKYNKKLWKIQKEETKKPAPSQLVGTNATMKENTEKNGIELKFTGKPSEIILQALKANGWRWSNYSKVWYTKASDQARDFAKSIAS